MDGRTDLWTDERTYGRTNGPMDGRTYLWRDERTCGRTNGTTEGRTDKAYILSETRESYLLETHSVVRWPFVRKKNSEEEESYIFFSESPADSMNIGQLWRWWNQGCGSGFRKGRIRIFLNAGPGSGMDMQVQNPYEKTFLSISTNQNYNHVLYNLSQLDWFFFNEMTG